jgi:hypothetical protein
MPKNDAMFREDFTGSGKWATLAAWMNRVGRCLNNIRGAKGVEVEKNTAGGFDFYGKGRGQGGSFPAYPEDDGEYALILTIEAGESTLVWERIYSTDCPI